MKQGGMRWSEVGAQGMLQIRSSIASGRHLQDFWPRWTGRPESTNLLKSLPAISPSCML